MTTAPGPRLRASDAERERLADLLRTAMAEGRLTLAEGEERLTAAYAAVYRDELGALVADLPGGHRAVPDSSPAGRPARVAGRMPPDRRHPGRPAPPDRWPAPRPVVVFALLLAAVIAASVLVGRPVFWPVPLAFIGYGLLRHARR
ncbi:DUF1707 domain-containing protein [Plantactinospora siamensis]|uniref:DUF1707 domain-containing protein n=1 Tax=Plantactinospora siamensis TaxID=555372 RepID=A0ABV6P0W5_9ACTN